MDLYGKYKSPFGYQVGDNGIDSYGVDHSGFSTRDEIEYQTARDNRENQLMQMYNQQGVTEKYPQYGTNFWGGSPENNYGFGTSDISRNIENVTNQLNNNGFNSANNGQITTNSDYTVNTESLVGKPSSYFQNNNTYGSAFGANINGLSGNTNNLNNTAIGGFNQSTNFRTNPSLNTTPIFQNQTSTQLPNNNVPQLRMPAGSEQQITMPSYELQQQLQQPQTSAWDKVKNAANNFAGGTEAFSVGYATGATLGDFDKGMGTATAALTGNRNNYTMGRYATRQLQNDLQQQHPIAYGVGNLSAR